MNPKGSLLSQNEEQANIIVAKVMRVSLLIFTIIYILDVVGIFIIDLGVMTFTYVLGTFLLLLPSFLINVLKLQNTYIKYVNVLVALAFTTLISVVLTFHAIVLFVYPIAIANLYFSKKLNILAVTLTVICVSFGQLLGFYLEILVDKNFLSLKRLVLFGIFPRALILIGIAAIFTMFSTRTTKLLKKVFITEKELKKFHKEMVMGFATLVENKDGSTGGHIKRTTAYVRLLAEELKKRGIYSDELTEEYLLDLYQAAPMHDIGKIAVPDVILKKPGKLTEEEFKIIQEHTVKGGQIIKETFEHLQNKHYSQMAYEVSKFHHEKWNGKGYPEGLEKEAIPLCARIMAIADVFDAVSERRCYRDAMPLEQCFKIVEEGSGTSFEPLLVSVFLSIRDKIEAKPSAINAGING